MYIKFDTFAKKYLTKTCVSILIITKSKARIVAKIKELKILQSINGNKV